MGLSREKIQALDQYQTSEHYNDQERVALRYADAMTLSDQDVDDALFHELSRYFSEDAVVELTAVVAWENASSKFNRALRVESQGFWKDGD